MHPLPLRDGPAAVRACYRRASRLSPDGPEFGPFSFCASAGWQSHARVECGDRIVDIIADQFGAPPVPITGQQDRRYGRGEADGPCRRLFSPVIAPSTKSGHDGSA
ncbi:hypothetical protein [Ensifer sp.]|uniref:hypothetical protein n=1 Tax=Ensifer sp. TaxID=1872086 RepID=UPI0028A0225D|nr:hypothetical protein [Ensifer sp.]